ncbi:MAG: helix-hairpin-helix domain-containing protein [Verrucomicrobiaceae bacterium]
MKSFITFLSVIALGFSLNAADAPAKKKAAPKKAPAAEEAKPSAKIEAIAKTLTATQRTKLLNVLNEGDKKALMNIPGIGETRAVAIEKARPFSDVTGVVKVEGVGETTFAEMVAHAKAGFPDKKEAAKPEGETEKKKAPAKSKAAPKKKESKDSK